MKKYISFLIIFLYSLSVSAQVVYDYLKAADAYFLKADYASAAKYYEKYLGAGKVKMKDEQFDPYAVKSLSQQQKVALSNRQQATYNLAESYRHLNFPSKAVIYYQQAMGFDKAAFPLAAYWYAKGMRSLAKYEQADSAFTMFIKKTGTTEIKYITDATRELNNLKFIKSELSKNSSLFTVNKLTAAVNADGANYAPVKINNNMYWFTSTRKETDGKNNTYTNKIYTAVKEGANFSAIQKAAIPQSLQHQGVISATPNGNTIFLTSWTIVNGKKVSNIYTSTQKNNTWSEPALLDSTINVGGACTQQPFVMPDGTALLFSSDRKDGYGGFDLWSVALDKNAKPVAGTVKNLGSTINSMYDEQAPYYHVPSSSLIFSSNGYVGMGGYDFFVSKGTLNSWSKPENLGYPLNSVKDDIYFTSNGTAKNILGDVLFSSDRSSDCCLEMFALNKVRPVKQISGLVVDCETKQPINGASVSVVNSKNQVVLNNSTNAAGTYNFTVEDFDAFTTTAKATGYQTNTVTTNAVENDDLIKQQLNNLCLVKQVPPPPPPPKVDTVVVMDNIYFEFNKATLLEESHAAIDNQILSMLNKYPTMVIEIGGHTDSQGKDDYNLKLSQARAESVKKYLIEKGIAAERMEAKGYGEAKPVAPNTINGKDNPEGRKKNRRTEFRVLHY